MAIMAEYHKIAGQLGGQETVRLYGSEHMSAIGRLGGRPRWQETLGRYKELVRGSRKIRKGAGQAPIAIP